ncbi:pinin/SDK/memA/ protein conserved region-domain-containing protein [Aspergillus californicus]
MAEGSLASVVIIPDQDAIVPSPDSGLKRRQSLTTELDSDTKRRRLSTHNENQEPEPATKRRPSTEGQAEPKRNRRDDERKRGQRLFGSVLGTLSQSSSSAAQRRRADIERKQQDKLKSQDEEYGELKKKKKEERLALRKKEQRLYEKEMMHTRHGNLLATANFLKTKAEPILYYKPWQLRRSDEAIIRDQIQEAEATVAREVEEFDTHNAHEREPESGQQELETESAGQAPASGNGTEVKTTEQQADESTAETHHDKDPQETIFQSAPVANEEVSADSNQDYVHRTAEDDGGEVVEDNEDTVIY